MRAFRLNAEPIGNSDSRTLNALFVVRKVASKPVCFADEEHRTVDRRFGGENIEDVADIGVG